jgi:hypothetical protein
MTLSSTTVRLLLVICLGTSGCAYALQAPTPRERELAEKKWKEEGTLWPPPEEATNGDFVHPDYRDSAAYCKNVQTFGNRAFKRLVGWGWVVSAVGAAGAGGLAAGAAKADETGTTVALAGLAGLSAVVTGLGVYMIDMGANGRRASASAAAALAEKDEDDRWQKCTEALKVWGGANADTAQEAGKAIAEAIKKANGKGDGDQKDKDKGTGKKDEKKNSDAKGQSTSTGSATPTQ